MGPTRVHHHIHKVDVGHFEIHAFSVGAHEPASTVRVVHESVLASGVSAPPTTLVATSASRIGVILYWEKNSPEGVNPFSHAFANRSLMTGSVWPGLRVVQAWSGGNPGPADPALWSSGRWASTEDDAPWAVETDRSLTNSGTWKHGPNRGEGAWPPRGVASLCSSESAIGRESNALPCWETALSVQPAVVDDDGKQQDVNTYSNSVRAWARGGDDAFVRNPADKPKDGTGAWVAPAKMRLATGLAGFASGAGGATAAAPGAPQVYPTAAQSSAVAAGYNATYNQAWGGFNPKRYCVPTSLSGAYQPTKLKSCAGDADCDSDKVCWYGACMSIGDLPQYGKNTGHTAWNAGPPMCTKFALGGTNPPVVKTPHEQNMCASEDDPGGLNLAAWPGPLPAVITGNTAADDNRAGAPTICQGAWIGADYSVSSMGEALDWGQRGWCVGAGRDVDYDAKRGGRRKKSASASGTAEYMSGTHVAYSTAPEPGTEHKLAPRLSCTRDEQYQATYEGWNGTTGEAVPVDQACVLDRAGIPGAVEYSGVVTRDGLAAGGAVPTTRLVDRRTYLVGGVTATSLDWPGASSTSAGVGPFNYGPGPVAQVYVQGDPDNLDALPWGKDSWGRDKSGMSLLGENIAWCARNAKKDDTIVKGGGVTFGATGSGKAEVGGFASSNWSAYGRYPAALDIATATAASLNAMPPEWRESYGHAADPRTGGCERLTADDYGICAGSSGTWGTPQEKAQRTAWARAARDRTGEGKWMFFFARNKAASERETSSASNPLGTGALHSTLLGNPLAAAFDPPGKTDDPGKFCPDQPRTAGAVGGATTYKFGLGAITKQGTEFSHIDTFCSCGFIRDAGGEGKVACSGLAMDAGARSTRANDLMATMGNIWSWIMNLEPGSWDETNSAYTSPVVGGTAVETITGHDNAVGGVSVELAALQRVCGLMRATWRYPVVAKVAKKLVVTAAGGFETTSAFGTGTYAADGDPTSQWTNSYAATATSTSGLACSPPVTEEAPLLQGEYWAPEWIGKSKGSNFSPNGGQLTVQTDGNVLEISVDNDTTTGVLPAMATADADSVWDHLFPSQTDKIRISAKSMCENIGVYICDASDLEPVEVPEGVGHPARAYIPALTNLLKDNGYPHLDFDALDAMPSGVRAPAALGPALPGDDLSLVESDAVASTLYECPEGSTIPSCQPCAENGPIVWVDNTEIADGTDGAYSTWMHNFRQFGAPVFEINGTPPDGFVMARYVDAGETITSLTTDGKLNPSWDPSGNAVFTFVGAATPATVVAGQTGAAICDMTLTNSEGKTPIGCVPGEFVRVDDTWTLTPGCSKTRSSHTGVPQFCPGVCPDGQYQPSGAQTTTVSGACSGGTGGDNCQQYDGSGTDCQKNAACTWTAFTKMSPPSAMSSSGCKLRSTDDQIGCDRVPNNDNKSYKVETYGASEYGAKVVIKPKVAQEEAGCGEGYDNRGYLLGAVNSTTQSCYVTDGAT